MKQIFKANKNSYILELETKEFDMFANEFIKEPEKKIFKNKFEKRIAIIELSDLKELQLDIIETLIGNSLNEFYCIGLLEK